MKNMRFVRDSGPYKAGEIHGLDEQTALTVFIAGDACNTEEAPNASLQPSGEVEADAAEAERLAAEKAAAEKAAADESERLATEKAAADKAEADRLAAGRVAPEQAAVGSAPETK